MDFASQAHRDKLNFGIKTPTIYYPLLVTISETAYTNQSESHTTDPVASQVTENSLGLEYCEG
jgi:hypothetical protein